MANVLGELFSEIANAIREKTGDTATMKPAEFPAKISSITVGGSSEVAVVAEKEYLFAKNGAAYYSMPNIDSNLVAFELVADKEYRVMWDGTSYTCTALRSKDPAGVLIGNPAMLGVPVDTGEPFLIGVMDDVTPAIVTTDGAGDTTTHTVGVYTEGSGGGSCDDVRYVTFMNGDTELYVKPVATGDDCVDVVAKGLIPAPTKASTAQYTYTHNGWSLTAGGAANASALSAVTEDRTVYAAFAASTRYYTVRFFDGTTLVDTVQVPYGGTAETTYEKTGYSLVGWTPSNVNITANTDCYGEWAAGNYIADDWATINANAASYDIGQKKTVTLNYADGTSETIDFTIVDKNVDKMQDGSMAALTFMADNAVKDSTVAASSNPQIDITQCDVMKEFLSGIFSAFPSDLQNVIKPVNKVNLGGYPQVFHIGPWNLTGKEGCWKGTYMDRPQMYQYKYFADGNETRRYKLNGTIAVYWLSTNAKAPNMNGTRYYDVYGNGRVTSSTHAESHDVVPCFCV